MAGNATIMSISLPKSEERWIERTARQEKTTKSALVREAIRQYQLSQQWREIRTYGRRVALRMGIETYDDVDRIAGKR